MCEIPCILIVCLFVCIFFELYLQKSVKQKIMLVSYPKGDCFSPIKKISKKALEINKNY